jgi:hypothetical protein
MAGVKGFRYIYAAAQLTKTLEKIQKTGRPDKLNFRYMRDTWLLKNAQYTATIDVLEDMGFIDSSGVPTDLYAQYQNPALAKKALATGVKKAYPELFKAYPHAYAMSRAELEGYFKQQTGKAGSTLGMMVSTFRTLCSLAEFSAVEGAVVEESRTYGHEDIQEEKVGVSVKPNVYINIEIHISPEMTDEKIETMFKNMKRYLLTNE